MNLTNEQKAVLLEAVGDYIDIYENHSKLAERVKAAREVVAIAQEIYPCSENVASLVSDPCSTIACGGCSTIKTELAAALGDIIAYRRMRYADSAMEEARFRELTGHEFDDE